MKNKQTNPENPINLIYPLKVTTRKISDSDLTKKLNQQPI